MTTTATDSLCHRCKKAPIAKGTLCEPCREYQRTWQKNRRKTGQCGSCTSMAIPGKKLCEDCALKNTAKRRESYFKTKEEQGHLCFQCGCLRDGDTMLCSLCSSERNVKQMAKRTREKEIVYKAYGGYRCNCCGEIGEPFLAIDHVNGDGKQHREKIGAVSIYTWLIRNNFPTGFQILCHSCNRAKLDGKECPHVAMTNDLLRKLRSVPLTY